MRKKITLSAFVLISFALTCAAIATGAYFRAGLTLVEGTISDIRIRATRDVVDEYATDINRQAARILAENLEPVLSPDPSEWAIVQNNLEDLHSTLLEVRAAYQLEWQAYEYERQTWEAEMQTHEEFVAAEHNRVYQENLMLAEQGYELLELDLPEPPAEPVWLGESILLFANVPFHFSEADQSTIITMSDEVFDMFWEAVWNVAADIQINETIQAVDFFTERLVQRGVGYFFTERVMADLIEDVVLRSLRINAIPDEAANEQRFLAALNNYEHVIIHEGQIIVDEGEEITAEILSVLNSLGLLAPDTLADNLFPMLGVFFLVAVLFVICIMFISFYSPKMISNLKDAALLFTLYVLTLSLVWALSDFSYFILPILIFPFLTSVLISRRMAMVHTFALVIISFFIAQSDIIFLLYFCTAGFLVCLFSRYTTERAKIIVVGMFVSLIQFGLSFSIILIINGSYVFYDLQSTLILSIIAAINGLLTVIISMGSLPFWETLFGVVTPIKLLDLTNPTNALLRRITIEAPGTYHHSLIVANLAETAALDIGANAHAARVGGYYHDCGKLKFPHYFVENIDGENPHDHMEPMNSAQLIMSHVSYGLTLAGEHRLPQFVRDIIKEHHGTTLMQYFFTKAKNSGLEVDEADFRYPFIIPQTRESAIVMLADSVEAAARSMMPKLKSLDELGKIIENIIRGKLTDGQLADSQLSIHDVSVIEKSFYRVLKGMYHERIAYPAPKAAPKRRVPSEATA